MFCSESVIVLLNNEKNIFFFFRIISARQMLKYLTAKDFNFSNCFSDENIPIYSTSLRDFTLCCSNMESKFKLEMYDKIRMMQGKISQVFTANVTHLITNKVGSEKYYVFYLFLFKT
jgi:hypothetical protein